MPVGILWGVYGAYKKVIAEAPPGLQPVLADRASATVGLRELADQTASGIKKWYAKITQTLANILG